MRLAPAGVRFASASIVDSAARVFSHDGRVFRAVYAERAASAWRRLLDERWIGEAFDAGLVRTWVPDVQLEGARLVLEHERIPFATYPAESTSRMHHDSATALVRLGQVLARHGMVLTDAHPWNVLFHRGAPRYVDFGSIAAATSLSAAWVREFRRYYAAPIWLASIGSRELAREYRREHGRGFGLRVFDLAPVRRAALGCVGKLERRGGDPTAVLDQLAGWLVAHAPKGASKERWASYQQAAGSSDPLGPTTPKQRFVHDVLLRTRPRTVLDCAANKGHYSEMAARLGASVAAFDCEEYCVDECLALARRRALDVSPALMDFRMPTPPSGWALSYDSAYERFRSELVLALGLCHHLCIAQGVPVRLFCEICMSYATEGVVLEFVDPADVHVASWRKPTPPDYSLDMFSDHFAVKFPGRRFGEEITDGGLRRRMVHFHR
jgi:hypothetical protein